MIDILNSYSLKELKKIISSTNIKGYSKMKKDEIIKLMMKQEHKDKFKDIKKKEKPENKPEKNLIILMENFNKKYNPTEIKKQKLTKVNLKKFTDPYFIKLEEIKTNLEKIEDPINFFNSNKKLSTEYRDIEKNFIRRIKAQLKKK